jgi:hypothetical protein
MAAASAFFSDSDDDSFHIAVPNRRSTKIYIGCLETIHEAISGREKSFTIYTATQVGFTAKMCMDYMACQDYCQDFEEESEEVRFFNEDEASFNASNAEKINMYNDLILRYHRKRVAERKLTSRSN